jgi:hypothetical protein
MVLRYGSVVVLLQMLASNMTPWQAPAVAALPFGANSTRYVALELHYNNPEGLTGQHDTGSGIRWGHTSNYASWAQPFRSKTSNARVASVRGTITVQLCMGDRE